MGFLLLTVKRDTEGERTTNVMASRERGRIVWGKRLDLSQKSTTMSRLPPVSLNRYVWQEAQVQVLGFLVYQALHVSLGDR